MKFDEIKKLKRRCDHFVGALPPAMQQASPGHGWKDREQWKYLAYTGPAEGMGVAAHNYSDMTSLHFTYTDWLLWLNDLARSFNRYIDANRVTDDPVAKQCLRWWRNFLFFDVEALA